MEGGAEEGGPGEESDTSSQRKSSPHGGGQKDLIRTCTLGAEPQAALSVYLAPQYQSHIVVRATPQQDAAAATGGGGGSGAPQPLNPSALVPQQAAEPHFRHTPDLLQYSENFLQVWGEGGVSDCCETTFIEGVSQDTSSTAVASGADERLLFADSSFLDFSGEDPKIHTLSQDVDDDDEFQELEVMFHLFSIYSNHLHEGKQRMQ